MRANLSNHDYELLSAYIDGQLSSGEQRKLEERLRARPEMQSALEDMRRTRALLRQAPRRRAPRNFTLTPAMVGEQRKRPAPFFNLFPALGFTSALAALALVVLVVMQLGPGAAQPQMVAMQAPAVEQAAVSEETARQGEPAAQDNAAAESGMAMMPAATQPAEAAPGAGVMEAPAEEPPAAVMAEPAAEPGAAEDQAPHAAEAQPAGEATAPPVVIWNDPAAAPKGMGGMGGVGGGGGGGEGPSLGPLMGPPPAPEAGAGMGGAAEENLMLPPESAPTPETSAKQLEAEPTPAPETQPVEDAGTGPILGVPEAGEGGVIVDRKAIMGETEQEEQPASTEAPVAPAVEEQPQSEMLATPTAAALEKLEVEPTTAVDGAVEPFEPTAAEPALQEGTGTQPDAAQPTVEAARSMKGEEAQNQAAPQQAPQPEAVEEAAAQPAGLFGLDPRALLAVEIGLGLLAVVAGAGAVIARRRSR